jgi:hypothetical protein
MEKGPLETRLLIATHLMGKQRVVKFRNKQREYRKDQVYLALVASVLESDMRFLRLFRAPGHVHADVAGAELLLAKRARPQNLRRWGRRA